jgi:steroid delta-isomerase-like uncharacterized protein
MSADDNKRLVQQGFDRLFNQGQLALADELVSADFLNHDAPPDAPRGPAGLRSVVTMLRTAFPDLQIKTAEMVAEGDKVAVRATLRGTHTGPFMGIPPTGRRVEQEQIHILRFAGGKTVEHWAVRDDLGLLRQLGVIPEPAQSGL